MIDYLDGRILATGCGGGRIRRRFTAPVAALTLILVAVLSLPGAAQPPEQRSETQAVTDELERDTPRSAMRGYLVAARAGDWERAARYLDLSRLAPGDREARAADLARELKAVLDRRLWVELESLSDAPDGERDDGLPPGRDRVGAIVTEKGSLDVLLERVPRPDGTPVWKISSDTVAKIPELYEQLGYGVLGELLPPVLFEIRFLEAQLWQWIGLLVIATAAAFVSWLVTFVGVRLVRPLLARAVAGLDGELASAIAGPVRLAIAVAIFYSASYLLALSVPVQRAVNGICKVLVILAVTWFLIRLTEMTARSMERRFRARQDSGALALLPLGRKAVKVFLVVLAFIAVLQNLGFDVTGILAGLGVGGLAVALAAQKTVENLFGAVTLTADQPVRVGDFCRFGDRVGTVEDIGLRSTRIRTLDRTVVSVPNSEFASLQLENFAVRDRIWLAATIGVRYETTPEQMRYLLIELKRMLLAHPKVEPDPARVRFVGFGAYSLDLEFFAYTKTADINEFFAIREDILLRIMDTVLASGTGFAFPSQTNYFARDSGLDEEKTRAAEDQVRTWRERGELFLPNFPPERAAEIGSLDYPPKGSPAPA